jgi:hypothetical protein
VLLPLLAVLSLGSAVTIDVPFVPQTDVLCGGASVAMVWRYWGDLHADAEQFTSLVEHRATGAGIATGRLALAVRTKGWRTESTNGSIADLQARLAAAQPVVVLLAERRKLYHYVVVVGIAGNTVVVHDPSRGPSRVLAEAEFERRWSAAQHWSLVILPAADRVGGLDRAEGDDGPPSKPVDTPRPADPCQAQLSTAIDELARSGVSHADEILEPIRRQCPDASGPVRELAAARFAQRRWPDAAALAREAISLEGTDQYAHMLLGASLFMLDDQLGALRAWNAIGEPRLNQVRIEGLQHSRYQTVTDALGLRPNATLTADEFIRARRRLEELPDRASARLALRPEDDGFASVDVVISERSGIPHGRVEWVAAGTRAAVNREVAVALPGTSGQGEVWSASWRWWSNRPKVAVGFAAPHVAGLFGVWRVDGSWEAESYTAGGPELVRETRGHGGLTVSDWLSGSVRYSLSAGVDAWSTLKAASIGASLERRWFGDRLALGGEGTTWFPVAGRADASSFNTIGVTARLASSTAYRGWRTEALAGVNRVSDRAPLTLWPGAGEGFARSALLRAHPLLEDGAIDVSGTSVFGRSLTHASIESQRWLERPPIVKLGLAGFLDFGESSRQMVADSSGRAQIDVGGGIRLRLPGAAHVLRVDFAHGLRDGANAFSIGWVY